MLARHPWSPALAFAAIAAALAVFAPDLRSARAAGGRCPDGMVRVDGKFCIDRYEAAVVEITGKRSTRKHSPSKPVDGLRVKAISKKGVIPQGYISRNQAEEACKAAGKRLCTSAEWLKACKGKRPTKYPYGNERKPGKCNDRGRSSFNKYYGQDGGEPPVSAYTWENMNDARLNQLRGGLARTGAFKGCRSGWGVYDLVGNLHEWTSDPNGTFRGGYYLDVQINGEGCDYKTTAHTAKYHDYSTGFRCCK